MFRRLLEMLSGGIELKQWHGTKRMSELCFTFELFFFSVLLLLFIRDDGVYLSCQFSASNLQSLTLSVRFHFIFRFQLFWCDCWLDPRRSFLYNLFATWPLFSQWKHKKSIFIILLVLSTLKKIRSFQSFSRSHFSIAFTTNSGRVEAFFFVRYFAQVFMCGLNLSERRRLSTNTPLDEFNVRISRFTHSFIIINKNEKS